MLSVIFRWNTVQHAMINLIYVFSVQSCVLSVHRAKAINKEGRSDINSRSSITGHGGFCSKALWCHYCSGITPYVGLSPLQGLEQNVGLSPLPRIVANTKGPHSTALPRHISQVSSMGVTKRHQSHR